MLIVGVVFFTVPLKIKDNEMLDLGLGILVGVLITFLFKLQHKHNYEVLFSRSVDDIKFKYCFTKHYPSYPTPDNIFVIYKKCKKCGNVFVNLGNGDNGRYEFHFDKELLRDKIESIMREEQKHEDEKLLNSVSKKLDEKYDSLLQKNYTNTNTEKVCE